MQMLKMMMQNYTNCMQNIVCPKHTLNYSSCFVKLFEEYVKGEKALS